MANFAYSIGSDIQIVLTDPFGNNVDLSNIVNFEAKTDYNSIKFNLLSGQRVTADLPAGWSGTIKLARANAEVDQMFATIEANWRENRQIGTGSIYANIIEPDGGTTSFQLTNCSFKYEEPGSWSGNKEVQQKIGFMADERVL